MQKEVICYEGGDESGIVVNTLNEMQLFERSKPFIYSILYI